MYVKAFISYGKHGNEPLIHLYGFAIPDNSEEIYNFVDPLQVGTSTRLLFGPVLNRGSLRVLAHAPAHSGWLRQTCACEKRRTLVCRTLRSSLGTQLALATSTIDCAKLMDC
jgi:hypothetical protein